jgi:hypothetical protein
MWDGRQLALVLARRERARLQRMPLLWLVDRAGSTSAEVRSASVTPREVSQSRDTRAIFAHRRGSCCCPPLAAQTWLTLQCFYFLTVRP